MYTNTSLLLRWSNSHGEENQRVKISSHGFVTPLMTLNGSDGVLSVSNFRHGVVTTTRPTAGASDAADAAEGFRGSRDNRCIAGQLKFQFVCGGRVYEPRFLSTSNRPRCLLHHEMLNACD
jgi:hypothetical protein